MRRFILATNVSKSFIGQTGQTRDSPRGLVVEEPIGPLLEFLRNVLGLLVALEPSLILLVKPPALAFQRLRCQVLLVRPLPIVEGVEQAVSVDAAVQSGIIKDA